MSEISASPEVKTIFEAGAPGRKGAGYFDRIDLSVQDGQAPLSDPLTSEADLPERFRRKQAPALPEVGELDVVRHFTLLSDKNFSVDKGFYPLGSCTMKYNPKVNENAARLHGFARIHPYQPSETVQGALELIWNLQTWLSDLSGMHAATLTPSAGAHGELLGLQMIRAYHESRGEERGKVLVPDSAHGTNPASATLAGLRAVSFASDENGRIDLKALEAALDSDVAAIMITNPNTHGLFETGIEDVARLVHSVGAQMYCDGANMNALLGSVRFGDASFDLCHINLHKTFSTPHGGGGPGAGALCVKDHLEPFLPIPLVSREGDTFVVENERPQSVGRIRSFYGNFMNLVRAYVYIRALGRDGLTRAGNMAVLNANYLLSLVSPHLDAPFGERCMHEFVVTAKNLRKETGVRAIDIAKGLLDRGFHAPTMYFPLTVEEALLIEPTETENLQTLREFAGAIEEIIAEARENPETLKAAPITTPVGRLDEAEAARRPVLRWTP